MRALPLIRRVLHRALNLPIATAVKVPLKNAWWRLRGRKLTNPELPRVVQSVLFVCLGNICRSPFAAARAGQLLKRAGIRNIHCASAGLSTTQANRSPQEACAAAARFGLSLDVHAPVQMTSALIAEYDVTVVMEAEQLIAVQQRFGDVALCVVLLPLLDDADLGGYAKYNIADPFGQPQAAFERCYERIDRALHPLVALIARHHAPGAQPRFEGPR